MSLGTTELQSTGGNLPFNESQSTLVNLAPPSRLVFSIASPHNATLFLKNRPYFRLVTKNPASGSTKLIDPASGEVLSSLKRRSLQPDTIQFKSRYDGRKLLVRDWLKEKLDADGKAIWIIETPSDGAFSWRTDMAFRLVLTPEADATQLLAWVDFPGAETGSSLAITFTPGIENHWEEVVTSFCYIEQKIRWKERTLSRSVGKSLIIPM